MGEIRVFYGLKAIEKWLGAIFVRAKEGSSFFKPQANKFNGGRYVLLLKVY